jgi:hypothetical protein
MISMSGAGQGYSVSSGSNRKPLYAVPQRLESRPLLVSQSL